MSHWGNNSNQVRQMHAYDRVEALCVLLRRRTALKQLALYKTNLNDASEHLRSGICAGFCPCCMGHAQPGVAPQPGV